MNSEKELKRKAKKFEQNTIMGFNRRMKDLDIGVEGDLSESLRARRSYRDGDMEKISFQFLRRGIFTKLGVGRGYPISRVQGMKGLKRRAKDWITDVLAENMDDFTEEIGDVYSGNAALTLKRSLET